MEQVAEFIARVSAALDERRAPSQRQIGRDEWSPLLGTPVQALVWALIGRGPDRRNAREARQEYERIEADARAKQHADAAAARRELDRAKATLAGAQARSAERPGTAIRWARRLAELRVSLAVSDRLRMMSPQDGVAEGMPEECVAWMQAIHVHNVHDAGLLTVDLPLVTDTPWYSKVTGLVGPHMGTEWNEAREHREWTLGDVGTRKLSAAVQALRSAEMRRQRAGAPSAEAILEGWRRNGSMTEHVCRARAAWQGALHASAAEARVVRMRSRAAAMDQLRATTRGLIDVASRQVDASAEAARA